MKSINKLSVLFIFGFFVLSFLSSCSPPQSQTGYPDDFPAYKKEKFYFDPLVFFDSDSLKPRLDLYIELPTENMLFRMNNSSNKYESDISVTVHIENSVSNQEIIRVYDKFYSYSDEEMKKISKESHYLFFNYEIESGHYNLEIKIKDKYSGKEYTKYGDFTVKDFDSADIASSSIMVLSGYSVKDDGTNEITPLISNNIFGLREFFIFFELYNKNKSDVIKEYYYIITDKENNVIKEAPLIYTLSPGINKKIERIDIARDIKKFLPEEPDFDFFIFDNEANVNFNLELIDKSDNVLVSGKNLLFMPDKRPEFHMQRRK